MSLERAGILEALPRVFRRDPQPVAALTLTYTGAGTCTAAVVDGAFVLAGEDGAPSETVPLTGTLGELAGLLAAVAGVTCVVSEAAAGALPATMLLDEPARGLSVAPLGFVRWRSPLWQLLDAIAEQLRGLVAAAPAARAQLNLLTAGGAFADAWGALTGTVRRAGEADGDYTTRQLHELLRGRENNQALAALLEEGGPGIHVTEVADLEREVFVCSGSPLRGRPLAGARHNACTIEVRLDGFPSAAVLAIARAHVAAGVEVFVHGRYALPTVPSEYDIGDGVLVVGEPPAMQIGVGRIGVGRIGNP